MGSKSKHVNASKYTTTMLKGIKKTIGPIEYDLGQNYLYTTTKTE